MNIPGWIRVKLKNSDDYENTQIDNIASFGYNSGNKCLEVHFKKHELYSCIQSSITENEIIEMILKAQCIEVNVSGPVISTIHMQCMKVCSVCGNKRCPKASNDLYKCTGSKEPGQVVQIDDEAIPNSVF